MEEPGRLTGDAHDAEADRDSKPFYSRASRSASELGELGWSAARSVTSALESARAELGEMLGATRERVFRTAGDLADLTDDLRAYFDPLVWMEDFYMRIGVATTARVEEIDDRIDRVESEMDHVARQRAREELLLLQQRIGELERILRSLRGVESGRTKDAMGALLGRLSKLETKIDAMPWKRFEPGAN